MPAGDNSPCEGDGAAIQEAGCLARPEMAMEVHTFSFSEREYKHFAPACTREEDGVEVTSARPGRRYVELAEIFGQNGFVYSICNADWNPAMYKIAKIAANRMNADSGAIE